MRDQTKRVSKFLSYVLRHRPDSIGIELDENGWVAVDVLLAAAAVNSKAITRELLDEVVATNDKKRFAFSDDGLRIRANQGHSIAVDLALDAQIPPDKLYHGTVQKFLDTIMKDGLIKGKRHHVHLSGDIETATKVGSRRGKPVLLEVAAKRMHRAGHSFYQSRNGVWLTDAVPPAYLHRLDA